MSDVFATIPWADVLGLTGVVIYLGAYVGLQAGVVRGQGYLYASMNMVGACFILLSLVENFNLSSAISQICFITISLFGIVRFYLLTHGITFTSDEQDFLNVVAPNLEKLPARQLLNLGTWRTASSGTVVAEQDMPLADLVFLHRGSAVITINERTVSELGDMALIGEISCLTGAPASATVTLNGECRVFEVDINVLSKFLVRNQAVRHELEGRFASHMGEKLIKASVALSAR